MPVAVVPVAVVPVAIAALAAAAVESIGATAGPVPVEAGTLAARPQVPTAGLDGPVAGPAGVILPYSEIASIEQRLRRADPDARPVPLVTRVSVLADSSYRNAWPGNCRLSRPSLASSDAATAEADNGGRSEGDRGRRMGSGGSLAGNTAGLSPQPMPIISNAVAIELVSTQTWPPRLL